MKKISLFIILILFTAAPAFAATLTVKTAGGGDYTTIQACANAAQAGDTCLVSAGTYNEVVTPPRDGSAGNWITFQAEDGQTPVVTGEWNLNGRNYIVIDGFEIGGGVNSHPSSVTVCSNIKILNNYFNAPPTQGINLKGDDILISGNTFDNMKDDMVRLFGDRWVVRNNTITDESNIDPNIHMDFFQSFCGGGVSGITAQYGLIENNVFIDVLGEHSHFFLINDTDDCNDPPVNIIKRYNKIHNLGSNAFYIDTNQQAPGATQNVIYNNTVSYLSLGSPAWETFVGNLSASENSTAINNIIHTSTILKNVTGFVFATGGSQSYNLYYSDSGTMTFTGDASSETGAIKNQNPLLTDPINDDFSLQAGSPAIDAGGPLTQVAADDTGSGTSLIVEKAEFFQPGWGGADPDTIAVGNKVAQISSIDYHSDTITLANSITRSDGDPVYLYKDSDGTQVFRGSAPDIGAVESGLDGGSSPPAAPTGLKII